MAGGSWNQTHNLLIARRLLFPLSHSRPVQEELYSASRPRGVQVQRVELKDLKILSSRQRCMALEAEAVRAARAKMMVAEGVVKTSHTLKEVTSGLSSVALTSDPCSHCHLCIMVCSLPIELLDMIPVQHP
ncbi:hypothetical protein ILYODFUR_035982 [Ilyodon furcidens]|uniref:Uncharacterized protein n=1 Tax=Ilyodon furcidens TaxID=33524 RepID=A0ABV0VK41_9TELE